MFFEFTNENFTQNIQFRNNEEYLLIDKNTNTLHFIVDIMNFDKQKNGILRCGTFISYISELSIYNFFNNKVKFDLSLSDYYMMPDSITRNRILTSTTTAAFLKNMSNDIKKLSKLLYKYEDVFVTDEQKYNILYENFYNECDKNHIQNFVKITIDYQLDYETTENILNNIVYEHILIEY
jgi:hypothetical protein